jgi:hypothetical protein
MKKGINEAIDWAYWSNCDVVPLGYAVLLALEFDPLGLDLHDNEFGPFARVDSNSVEVLIHYSGNPLPKYHQPEFSENKWKLYKMALGSVNQPKGLIAIDMPFSDAPSDMPLIRLKEFGMWLQRIKFPFPEGFPGTQGDLSPLPDGIQASEAFCNSEFIHKLIQIAYDNYRNIPAGENPNQKKVALEIDRAMGWKNQKRNEKASRTAIAIAARLQPARFQNEKK